MPEMEQRRPDDPHEWLGRARSNLIRARHSLDVPGIVIEHICFDAQQAVEQAVKAVLIARGARFPKTHDIGALLTLARREGAPVPEEFADARGLTQYAVTARYGNGAEPITEEERDEAIACAETVVQWAESLVESTMEGGSPSTPDTPSE